VVNGELAIVRWGRLLKEASSSSLILSFDGSTREKVLEVKDLLR
jgi:hypothetical protein